MTATDELDDGAEPEMTESEREAYHLVDDGVITEAPPPSDDLGDPDDAGADDPEDDE